MEKEIKAFQIDLGDNVATALAGIKAGQEAGLTGDRGEESIKAAADIPAGHKIALKDIGRRAYCKIRRCDWACHGGHT